MVRNNPGRHLSALTPDPPHRPEATLIIGHSLPKIFWVSVRTPQKDFSLGLELIFRASRETILHLLDGDGQQP